MLKEEFNRQRSKVDAIKQRVRESSALMSQQSKRAKTDLVALQMEIVELKQTEKDMDEWYGTVRSLTHLKILFFFSLRNANEILFLLGAGRSRYTKVLYKSNIKQVQNRAALEIGIIESSRPRQCPCFRTRI